MSQEKAHNRANSFSFMANNQQNSWYNRLRYTNGIWSEDIFYSSLHHTTLLQVQRNAFVVERCSSGSLRWNMTTAAAAAAASYNVWMLSAAVRDANDANVHGLINGDSDAVEYFLANTNTSCGTHINSHNLRSSQYWTTIARRRRAAEHNQWTELSHEHRAVHTSPESHTSVWAPPANIACCWKVIKHTVRYQAKTYLLTITFLASISN